MTVEHNPDLETLGNMGQLVIGTILPFIIIVFSNLWIFKMVHKASKERGKMGVSEQSQKTLEKETSHLTRMLILVSIAYVLTSIPYRLLDVILGIPQVQAAYNMEDEYWSLRYYCQYYVIEDIWMMNFAINFYLYCIGGGKKYRNDVTQKLKHVLFCCKKYF
jgi:hypothetical protein